MSDSSETPPVGAGGVRRMFIVWGREHKEINGEADVPMTPMTPMPKPPRHNSGLADGEGDVTDDRNALSDDDLDPDEVRV
jgi:hypothetical protein